MFFDGQSCSERQLRPFIMCEIWRSPAGNRAPAVCIQDRKSKRRGKCVCAPAGGTEPLLRWDGWELFGRGVIVDLLALALNPGLRLQQAPGSSYNLVSAPAKKKILASYSSAKAHFFSKCIKRELRTPGRFVPSFKSPAALVPEILSLYVFDFPPDRPQIRKKWPQIRMHRTVKSIFPRPEQDLRDESSANR